MVIENRYAASFFDLASEEGIIEEINQDILKIGEIFKKNSDLYSVLCAPNVEKEDKFAILSKIFTDGFNKYSTNFLSVLIEKNRINLILNICDEFVRIFKEYKNILDVTVTTVVELDAQSEKDLCAKLNKITGKEIELKVEIDTSILGGVILKYDNKLVDGSVKTKLLDLNSQINTGK